MSIINKENIFILNTLNTHYVIGICENGVYHIHWGKKCREDDYEIPVSKEENSNHSVPDFEKTEYAPFGGAIYRETALKCAFPDKCRDISLKYEGFEISGNTLTIKLADKVYSMHVNLIYRVFDDSDVIERYSEITNTGADRIIIERAYSAEFNFPSLRPYTVINSNGCWGNEFSLTKHVLDGGTLVFESRKGTAGHDHTPTFIVSQNDEEENGEVFFGALAYSGNFKVSLNRDFAGKTRAVIGVNDFDFSYNLDKGAVFRTPSVYCGYSQGYTQMSNIMNRFAVNHLLPEHFAHTELPVLYNSWEATEFDVNEKDQLALAKIASEIGCELFVMDDGWFGKRNDDHAGLGDWFVNRKKFPNGLKPLIDGVNALGMDFGIWVEPEMVNPDSDLYRKHPEWTYHFDTRIPTEMRNQLVLNMTKPEVQEYIFGCLDSLLGENNIKYIKWDMNRPFSEAGAENLENQKELWYRHVVAVYDIVDRLKEKYPCVQFEACASGGARAELGALSHYDMIWTSDNTDPLDRLEIQRGYSMLYPFKCMRAWVTDTNKKERPVSLDFRFNISMQGALSMGGNLLEYTDEEIATSKKYIALYKKIRPVVQFGDFYRIMNYDEDKIYLNGYVSEDKEKAVFFACTAPSSFFGDRYVNIKFRGLDNDTKYSVKSDSLDIVKSGAYLMNAGVNINYYKPLASEIFIVEKV